MRGMGRALTATEAAAALRRGAPIEQFLGLDGGKVTFLTAALTEGRYTVRRHLVWDEGREEFEDISEFSPVADEEDIGEGAIVAELDTAEDAVGEALTHGGAVEAWVNSGMAADDYWSVKHSRP
jgi:hypothetical protein